MGAYLCLGPSPVACLCGASLILSPAFSGIWEAMEKLDTLVDDSDPDVSTLDQISVSVVFMARMGF